LGVQVSALATGKIMAPQGSSFMGWANAEMFAKSTVSRKQVFIAKMIYHVKLLFPVKPIGEGWYW
jgi:hypothetical protein